MTLNTAGYVNVLEGAVPRIITGYAMEVISGGEFVFCSGADNVVSSGASSFVASDITISTDGSGAQCNGVAIANAASGAPVGFITRGVVIATADGTVTAGFPVQVVGANSVSNAGSATMTAGYMGRAIGRALTSAGSEGHCLVYLNL